MKMSRAARLRTALVFIIVLGVLVMVRLHDAGGAILSSGGESAGHGLAAAWCKECHAIEATPATVVNAGPNFVDVANRPSTTELSLKVFLQTNHPSMPNLIIAPDQADELVNYILSLKRR